MIRWSLRGRSQPSLQSQNKGWVGPDSTAPKPTDEMSCSTAAGLRRTKERSWSGAAAFSQGVSRRKGLPLLKGRPAWPDRFTSSAARKVAPRSARHSLLSQTPKPQLLVRRTYHLRASPLSARPPLPIKTGRFCVLSDSMSFSSETTRLRSIYIRHRHVCTGVTQPH